MFSAKGVETMKSQTTLKVAALVIISVTFFYLGKHWSDSPFFSANLIFFSEPSSRDDTSVILSPNANITFDATSLANGTTASSPPPPSVPQSVSPPPPKTFGIVDGEGKMANDFEVGEQDPEASVDEKSVNDTLPDDGQSKDAIQIARFSICSRSMREYIPCLDNESAIKRLNSTDRGERFERHCPEKGKELSCVIPSPKKYRKPIPWPRSRDEVWFDNVPHSRLVDDKGGQNWISRDEDKFRFPGGGTQFIHGADQYLDQIAEMVPDVAFGKHTRVVLDVGCGVASFGAYLLSRDVLTMSMAPKDVHENQIQFALERGVPAVIAVLATHRLLFPSQAFDMIHCSRCRINWTRDDGMLLIEANRLLRAGGFFTWAAQPVYKHETLLEEQWDEMLNLTTRLCWDLVKKEGYIAIWKKPLNNSCYLSREESIQPSLCEQGDDPDDVWYAGLKPCITRLPENGYGANVSDWPARLHTPPDRLQTIQIDAFTSRNDIFKAESKFWNEVIGGYIRAWHWKQLKLRNVLDMKANLGGFAAAFVDHGIDAWVMNVVPVSGPNTLPVIYDRGLLGIMHDWCEAFDTYPRTYDLLHAAGLFSVENKRCNISMIMLEMDRILRPGGRVYVLDTVALMGELESIARAIGWKATVRETSEGPHANFRIMTCDKPL